MYISDRRFLAACPAVENTVGSRSKQAAPAEPSSQIQMQGLNAGQANPAALAVFKPVMDTPRAPL